MSYRGNPIMSIRLAPELRAELAEIARKEGKPLADIIREALYRFLDEKQKEHP